MGMNVSSASKNLNLYPNFNFSGLFLMILQKAFRGVTQAKAGFPPATGGIEITGFQLSLD
jgi:hypothetical protein